MQVGKNWKVESDPLNVILLKRGLSKPKDGTPPKGNMESGWVFFNNK